MSNNNDMRRAERAYRETEAERRELLKRRARQAAEDDVRPFDPVSGALAGTMAILALGVGVALGIGVLMDFFGWVLQ